MTRRKAPSKARCTECNALVTVEYLDDAGLCESCSMQLELGIGDVLDEGHR